MKIEAPASLALWPLVLPAALPVALDRVNAAVAALAAIGWRLGLRVMIAAPQR